MRWGIVAVSKNEAPDLLEWACYHKLIGCERIYLYDACTDNAKEVLGKLITEGFVEFIPWQIYPAQYPAYIDALVRLRNTQTAYAFIDADEFILPRAANTVSDLLDVTLGPDVSGVAIGWEIFGHNGHEQRPDGLCVRNYTRKFDYSVGFETFTKCFLLPERISPAVHDPHWFQSMPGFRIVREDGVTLNWGDHHWRHPTPYPRDQIRLNHYFTKSRQDFMRKLARRGPDGNSRKIEDFEVNFRTDNGTNAVEDTEILKHAEKLQELIQCYKS